MCELYEREFTWKKITIKICKVHRVSLRKFALRIQRRQTFVTSTTNISVRSKDVLSEAYGSLFRKFCPAIFCSLCIVKVHKTKIWVHGVHTTVNSLPVAMSRPVCVTGDDSVNMNVEDQKWAFKAIRCGSWWQKCCVRKRKSTEFHANYVSNTPRLEQKQVDDKQAFKNSRKIHR